MVKIKLVTRNYFQICYAHDIQPNAKLYVAIT